VLPNVETLNRCDVFLCIGTCVAGLLGCWCCRDLGYSDRAANGWLPGSAGSLSQGAGSRWDLLPPCTPLPSHPIYLPSLTPLLIGFHHAE